MSVQWSWKERIPSSQDMPIEQAAVAWGAVIEPLLLKLEQLPADTLSQLTVVVHEQVWVVLGPSGLLPWVDGISYAAPAQADAKLWLPLLHTVTMNLDLLAQRLNEQYKINPLLLWPQPNCVIPLHQQYPLSQQLLTHLRQLRGMNTATPAQLPQEVL